MVMDVDKAMAETTVGHFEWNGHDAVVYAHGIGYGARPLEEHDLVYLNEPEPLVFPTFLASLARTGGPLSRVGLDMRGVLHGEHALTFHRTVPAAGRVSADGRMLGVWDKGPGKGAIFAEEKRLVLENGEPLATIVTTVVGRLEGGCGSSGVPQPVPHTVPQRPEDAAYEIETTPNQALVYRLSGDLNPIHYSPAAAAASGFDRPILHGLCTYALCGRAVVDCFAERDPARLAHIQARFSAPVFPGDKLRVRLWRDGPQISFEAEAVGREALVIKGGLARLRDGEQA